ncbi:MAG: SDR family oxidoreductase [Steroidobacteraceae bacterium]
MSRPKAVVVTGATSGIGAAVARAFSSGGARVFLIARNPRRLAAIARTIPSRRLAGSALADFGSTSDLKQLLAAVCRRLRRIDVLVHAAGEYSWTEPGSLDTGGFDRLFDVNVRAPYLLTQGLLPLLERARGQVIFLNSSVVRSPGQGVAAFKATQHAVQGLADSLRQDFNRRGIRISSVFPGRTATPRMRRIYAREGKPYRPGMLMSAADVAKTIIALSGLPGQIEITEVHLRSLTPYSG